MTKVGEVPDGHAEIDEGRGELKMEVERGRQTPHALHLNLPLEAVAT
jgi:hypothetical protein